MKRREFVLSLLALKPLHALAKEPGKVIGFLRPGSPDETQEYLRAFLNGLKQTGYTDGKNVKIEFQFATADTSGFQHWPLTWLRSE